MSYFIKKFKQKYLTRDGDTLYFGSLKRIFFVFMIFVFFLVIGVYSWIKFMQNKEGVVKVPKIIGKNILEASELLQSRKLNLKIIPVIRNDIPRYQIVQQNPSENTTVRQNRVIEVIVSSGQIFSRVPNFIGQGLYTVKQLFMGQKQIQGMGKMILANITYVPSDKPVNTVIAQTPNPETGIQRDMPVYLVISNGINFSKVTIPNYQNKYFYQAVSELSANNITIDINSTASDRAMLGRVISQNPPAGSVLNPGDKVTLNVGSGGDGILTYKSSVIEYIVPSTVNGVAEIKIILSDEGDDKILYQGNVKAGHKIVRAVLVRGSAKYKIFINNKLIKDDSI